jgi:hypothetical protein
LKILDVAAFTGDNDDWFPSLSGYVDAVLEAVVADSKFNREFNVKYESPNLTTRKALKAAHDRYNPFRIFLDLEAAIRMEFFDFKNRWDAETA